ncbi:MAG: transcription termination/antitermination protein NusA [Alphaproteobacteria bacterium]|nr:transcription termination/antitermination protein NusA [Alphaproteobacteria bacterium]MBN2779832.1 transcription termination/antitermination protein NusA [Alphaproteobacteria bacterium]
MDFSKSLPRPELVAMVAMLAEEKKLSKDLVFNILQEAMIKVARHQYGFEHDLRIEIDHNTGGILVKRIMTVVEDKRMEEEDFNEHQELVLSKAIHRDKNLKIGDVIEDFLPPLQFGRQSFQSVRQYVLQSIRSADRERQFNEFKDKEGEIVSCVVTKNEYGNVFVDIGGKGEGFLKRTEMIPREMLHTGDRIRAYLLKVEESPSGPQIILSRTHPMFLAKLFEQEIPEVYEGEIEIKSVARDCGSHAKIAVYTENPTIDPVATCVGMKGARIQPIINEIQGEKIDVIIWSEDVAEFAVRALKPANVSKVVVDEKEHTIEIAVPQDELAIAIGRKGQNIRLASKLVGWRLDIMNEQDEADKRKEEIAERLEIFTKALDIDEVVARLLLLEGFRTLEEVAFVEPEELMSIEGFESELVEELQTRAKDYLDAQEKELEEKGKDLGLDESLMSIEGLTVDQKIKLGEAKIKTADDIADLAADELIEILPKISEKEANALIMKLREKWFAKETKTENNDEGNA